MRLTKKQKRLIVFFAIAMILLMLFQKEKEDVGSNADLNAPVQTETLHLIEDTTNIVYTTEQPTTIQPESTETTISELPLSYSFSLDTIPEWDGGTPYIEINENVPYFSASDLSSTEPFETYSHLDGYGRCGPAYANICVDLMPTEKRGSISSVKPSGWIQAEYPDLISTKSLYNRCHLIGFQLAGENANKLNLITGTRYLNVTGMLVFEDQVAEYIKDNPDNHVLYRVTPVFKNDELVARGVLIEAYSVEDQGNLEFCVYCYNNQPGIVIDYQTGESWRED